MIDFRDRFTVALTDAELLIVLKHYEVARQRIKDFPSRGVGSLPPNMRFGVDYAIRDAQQTERTIVNELHRRGGEANLAGRRLRLTNDGLHFYEPQTPPRGEASRTRQTPRRRAEATL